MSRRFPRQIRPPCGWRCGGRCTWRWTGSRRCWRTRWGSGWRTRPTAGARGRTWTRGSPSGFRAAIVARARFIEDLVTAAADAGVGQYVLLGAGLDTFVERRHGLTRPGRVSLNPMTVPFPSPTDPAGSRAEVFRRYLEFFRDRLAAKTRALPDEELRRSRLPSGWTPLELVKHLTYVERRWLEWGFEGRAVADPWGDQRDDRWYVEPDETLDGLLADAGRPGRAQHRDHRRPRPGRGRPAGRALVGPAARDARAGPVPPRPGVRPARRPPRHRLRAERAARPANERSRAAALVRTGRGAGHP